MARRAASPRIGCHPRLSTAGTSGPSAEGTRETTPAPVPVSRRSKGTWSRGAPAPGLEPPGGGQGIGQGGLLLEELAGPVPDPAGLDQHHQGVVAQQVGDQLLGVGQPRQPRLHAVELVAVGQPVPLVAPPRSRSHQAGRPLCAWPRRPPARGSRTARPGRGHRSIVGRRRRIGSAGPPRRPTGRSGPVRRRWTGRRRRCRRGRPTRPGARRATRAGSPCPPAGPPTGRPPPGRPWPPPPGEQRCARARAVAAPP